MCAVSCITALLDTDLLNWNYERLIPHRKCWWRQYDDFREWSTPRGGKYGFALRSPSALGFAVLATSDCIRRTESLPVGFDEVVSG